MGSYGLGGAFGALMGGYANAQNMKFQQKQQKLQSIMTLAHEYAATADRLNAQGTQAAADAATAAHGQMMDTLKEYEKLSGQKTSGLIGLIGQHILNTNRSRMQGAKQLPAPTQEGADLSKMPGMGQAGIPGQEEQKPETITSDTGQKMTYGGPSIGPLGVPRDVGVTRPSPGIATATQTQPQQFTTTDQGRVPYGTPPSTTPPATAPGVSSVAQPAASPSPGYQNRLYPTMEQKADMAARASMGTAYQPTKDFFDYFRQKKQQDPNYSAVDAINDPEFNNRLAGVYNAELDYAARNPGKASLASQIHQVLGDAMPDWAAAQQFQFRQKQADLMAKQPWFQGLSPEWRQRLELQSRYGMEIPIAQVKDKATVYDPDTGQQSLVLYDQYGREISRIRGGSAGTSDLLQQHTMKRTQFIAAHPELKGGTPQEQETAFNKFLGDEASADLTNKNMTIEAKQQMITIRREKEKLYSEGKELAKKKDDRAAMMQLWDRANQSANSAQREMMLSESYKGTFDRDAAIDDFISSVGIDPAQFYAKWGGAITGVPQMTSDQVKQRLMRKKAGLSPGVASAIAPQQNQ